MKFKIFPSFDIGFYLLSSECIAAVTANPIPTTTKTAQVIVKHSLKNAVLRLHKPFFVRIDNNRLMVLWINIHTDPPMNVRKAPNQWIFCTICSSLFGPEVSTRKLIIWILEVENRMEYCFQNKIKVGTYLLRLFCSCVIESFQ